MPPIGFIDVRRTQPKRKRLLMLSLSDLVSWVMQNLKSCKPRSFIDEFKFLFETSLVIDSKPVGN